MKRQNLHHMRVKSQAFRDFQHSGTNNFNSTVANERSRNISSAAKPTSFKNKNDSQAESRLSFTQKPQQTTMGLSHTHNFKRNNLTGSAQRSANVKFSRTYNSSWKKNQRQTLHVGSSPFTIK